MSGRQGWLVTSSRRYHSHLFVRRVDTCCEWCATMRTAGLVRVQRRDRARLQVRTCPARAGFGCRSWRISPGLCLGRLWLGALVRFRDGRSGWRSVEAVWSVCAGELRVRLAGLPESVRLGPPGFGSVSPVVSRTLSPVQSVPSVSRCRCLPSPGRSPCCLAGCPHSAFRPRSVARPIRNCGGTGPDSHRQLSTPAGRCLQGRGTVSTLLRSESGQRRRLYRFRCPWWHPVASRPTRRCERRRVAVTRPALPRLSPRRPPHQHQPVRR